MIFHGTHRSFVREVLMVDCNDLKTDYCCNKSDDLVNEVLASIDKNLPGSTVCFLKCLQRSASMSYIIFYLQSKPDIFFFFSIPFLFICFVFVLFFVVFFFSGSPLD